MTPKYPDDMNHNDNRERIALFAGSFNPFTIGHLSILQRGLELFDKVVVMVGTNIAKHGGSETADNLRQRLSCLDRVEVMQWDGLTVDAARKIGAKWLLRGVRSVADYEYERNLADINREIAGIDTVILFAEPQLAIISSSMVRELQKYGRDTSRFTL